MKKIITLVSATLIAVSMNAQTGSKTATQTAVATDIKATAPTADATIVAPEEALTLNEVEFNFGKIPQGKPVTHVFEVINKSNVALKIANVQASCGCTTPEWEREKTIAPGETTKITVGYNAAAEGPFTKQITITYNNPTNKVLTIKGEVWKTPTASAPENKGVNDLKN